MKKYLSVLQNCILFESMAQEEILQALKCLNITVREFEKNEFIFHATEPVTQVGIVLQGNVHIVKEDFWGNRTIVANAQAGDLFAEAFSCTQTKELPISVVAVQKTSVLFLHYQKIVTTCSSACSHHTKLIQNMLKVLAQKNISLTQKVEYMSQRTLRQKLLSYLSAQAVSQGQNEFQIPFNRQELADYLSVDRSALSSELSKLQQENILSFHKNSFILKIKD